MAIHSGSSFGSNTTQRRLANSVCSMNRVIRRTGTYIDWAKAVFLATIVRAPHTTVPIPAKLRRQLTASRLSTPCCGSFMIPLATGPVVLSTVVAKPAGAFQTPRAASVRANIPATKPLGATAMVFPVTGSVELR